MLEYNLQLLYDNPIGTLEGLINELGEAGPVKLIKNGVPMAVLMSYEDYVCLIDAVTQ